MFLFHIVSNQLTISISSAHSGDCKQQIRLNVLDFILFTDFFAKLEKVQRSNKDISLLYWLENGVAFSNNG